MSAAIPVIVNGSGGTAARMGAGLREAIEAAFAGAGAAIDLKLVDGGDLKDAVRAALGAPVVVVGGGDGSLGCAADILGDSNSALGILPVGTRNHLARDLGLPLDLNGAAAVIVVGHQRRIDLARANGRGFINNASIGLYPALVRFRDAKTGGGLPKWLAALPASYAALKRVKHHRLRLHVPGIEREVVTPMLFIGNNRYALAPGRLGQREALDGGMLSVIAVARRSRLALIGFALRTLIGRADPVLDFAAMGESATLRVDGRSHGVAVALDGEVTAMALPIDFAIHPRALAVVVPLEGGAATA
jgi:diacylglycerol kinase family enzyme